MNRVVLSEPTLPSRKDIPSNSRFVLRSIAVLDRNRPHGDPQDEAAMDALLHRLFRAGRHDIALGRLFEGHVDALQILSRYGSEEDLQSLRAGENEHPVLGVWNAEGPDHRLTFDGDRITGGKSYASGAGILSHALVTTSAGTPAVQLHLVDLKGASPETDESWWNVSGMKQSATHRVSWQGAKARPIGSPGDYEREPWFSGGALRFTAVQAGGIAGLTDAVRNHLVTLHRQDDPVQQRRLAELFGLASAATATVRQTGREIVRGDDEEGGAKVANARNLIYRFGEEAIAIAQRACGTAAYFRDNPVCRFAQDLGMYIRQPGPDAQCAKVGKAVANEALDPWQ
ncbi:acyl-CoA/acyl-ACP dehydrogenase [Notoacmeibacter marinus]|uniref:acyl-CoA/acyl-ACP dehydrogenase n=1 Tax=Notoacmeibacter marinus TaxID=1876515 RepID=UPI000B8BB4BC|nr:acyl-CoA/acyl-ACP dehydrogenase [Notoacmeibacter marinus]